MPAAAPSRVAGHAPAPPAVAAAPAIAVGLGVAAPIPAGPSPTGGIPAIILAAPVILRLFDRRRAVAGFDALQVEIRRRRRLRAAKRRARGQRRPRPLWTSFDAYCLSLDVAALKRFNCRFLEKAAEARAGTCEKREENGLVDQFEAIAPKGEAQTRVCRSRSLRPKIMRCKYFQSHAAHQNGRRVAANQRRPPGLAASTGSAAAVMCSPCLGLGSRSCPAVGRRPRCSACVGGRLFCMNGVK